MFRILVSTRTFSNQWLPIAAFVIAMPLLVQSVAADDHQSGAYGMDASHTSVIFKVNHLGFSTYIGRFDTVTGTLNFDEGNPTESELIVAIDTASINTNSEKLEEELRGAEMFNADAHPQISFVSTSIEKTGDTTGTISGDLSVAGVTKPVTLDVTFNGGAPHPFSKKYTLGFSATAALKRSEFGLDNWLPAIGDEVSLVIETEFQKQD